MTFDEKRLTSHQPMPFRFDNTYARLPEKLYARVLPTTVASPTWIATNEDLGTLLGLAETELESEELLTALAGNSTLEGSEPIALAYAGHQFGRFVPRLGDGRAILLGEVVGTDGVRRDIQLKGSGRTPFSRGGDGRAALGPVLREMLLSEAMFALGVPTTRSLAAVLTGEPVYRERPLPGAVLTRVAASHLRVGTFQYFAAQNDRDALATLIDYSLARHYPDQRQAESPALALLDSVMDNQIELVSRWLGLGFVHGVMNTDNCAISGETIDYGPCAFLDVYDPNRTFSSIDHQGRYAFANQPRIALWNMLRFAETLVPFVHEESARAVAMLESRLDGFQVKFQQAHDRIMSEKLGLFTSRTSDADLVQDLLRLMAADKVDLTLAFRRLTELASGEADRLTELFEAKERIASWLVRWRQRVDEEPLAQDERASGMRRRNPAFIPRNHRVEEMIEAAVEGDLQPFERLREVLRHPFDDQPEHAELALPPGREQWAYRTFCGT